MTNKCKKERKKHNKAESFPIIVKIIVKACSDQREFENERGRKLQRISRNVHYSHDGIIISLAALGGNMTNLW